MPTVCDKKRWGKILKASVDTGQEKGLVVKKCTFADGWSITLPNNTTYHAPTDHDMVIYVRDY